MLAPQTRPDVEKEEAKLIVHQERLLTNIIFSLPSTTSFSATFCCLFP